MTKRMGYAIGLLLATVGVGIPAVVVASSDQAATSNTEVSNTIEVAGTTSQGWANGDEYALGVDPFARVVEPRTPWAATTLAGIEALPDAGDAGTSGTSQRVSPSYALGTAEERLRR